MLNVAGIDWLEDRGRYRVRIYIDGKRQDVGYRKTPEEAIALFDDRTAAEVRRGELRPRDRTPWVHDNAHLRSRRMHTVGPREDTPQVQTPILETLNEPRCAEARS